MADDFKALLEEQKRTTRMLMSAEERAEEDARVEEAARKRSEAAEEGWKKRRGKEEEKQSGWLSTLGQKFVPAFLKKDKEAGSEEKEKKGKESAFRNKFTGWMKDSSKSFGIMAKNAFSAVKAKLPSLSTLLMTGGLAALLYFLRSPYFAKIKDFVIKELVPILANLWDNYIKPFGIFLKDKVVKFFKDLGGFVKDPSWETAGTLITENKGVLGALVGYLALKTFGAQGLMTGVKLVSTGITKAWGTKAVQATLGKMTKFIGPMALIAGLAMAIKDGIMGYFKSEEWGVSKVSGFFGGLFGGTGKGGFSVKGMGTNAAKWALIGAGLGSFIPIVGTAIGGAVGAIIGAVLGYFGGEKIAKGLDKFGTWIATQWTAMLESFKQIARDIKTWFTEKFAKDPGLALTELWNNLVKGWKNFGQWIFDNAVKPAWEWIKSIIGWKKEDSDKIKEFGMDMVGLVKEGLAKVWAAIKNLFSSLFDINWKSIMTSVVPDFIKNSVIGKAMGIADAPTAAQLAKDLVEAEGKLEQAQRIKGRAEKAASLGGRFAKGHQARAALQTDKIAELQKEIQEIKSQQAGANNIAVDAKSPVYAPTSNNMSVVATDMKGLSSAAQAALSSAW